MIDEPNVVLEIPPLPAIAAGSTSASLRNASV